MLRTNNTEIAIGLNRPVRILQIADVHLCYADADDRPEIIEHTNMRKPFFPDALQNFQEALAMEGHADRVVICGDVLDTLSYGNLRQWQSIAKDHACMFTPGNHEFSLEHYDDPTTYEEKLNRQAQLAPFFQDGLEFASEVIGGVNLIALDNSDYCFHAPQVEKMRAEIAKGLPIALFVHIPFYSESLVRALHDKGKTPMLLGFQEDEKKELIKDPATEQMVELLRQSPLVRVVLAGHVHMQHDGLLPWGIPQHVEEGCYQGSVGLITLT